MKYCKIKTIIVFSTVLILLSSCSNKSETESKENESKSENTSYVFESVDTEDTSTEESAQMRQVILFRKKKVNFQDQNIKLIKPIFIK